MVTICSISKLNNEGEKMSLIKAPENTQVWVDESRCKACDICASVCPAGVLSMRAEPTSTLGAMVEIVAMESIYSM